MFDAVEAGIPRSRKIGRWRAGPKKVWQMAMMSQGPPRQVRPD